MMKKILPMALMMVLAVVNISNADLVAYWPMDDGTGTAVTDASGNGADGVLTDGTWAADGILGGAIEFDGVSGNITIPIDEDGHATLSGDTPFSVSLWVKTTSTEKSVLVQQRDESGSGWYGQYQVSMNPNGTVQFYIYDAYRGGYGFNFTTETTINDGLWHHIVAYKDGGDGFIYIDGALAGSGSGASPKHLNASTKVGIGSNIRDADNPQVLLGLIDEVYIYDHALTEPEIATLHQLDEAVLISPVSLQTLVPADAMLEWASSANYTATSYDLYFTDSNSLEAITPVLTGTTATTYDPFGAADMAFDTEYFWKVDSYVNGTKHEGHYVKFTTRLAEPVILTQPIDTVAPAGKPVSLTVEAAFATEYQWFFNDTELTGENDATLTISSLTEAHEGSYKCVLTNEDSPLEIETDTVKIALERLIAHLPFEQNTSDISGMGNDGTFTGTTASYVAGREGLGQAIEFKGSADPNYVTLPLTILDKLTPRQVTIAFWFYGDAAQPIGDHVFEARAAEESCRVLSAHVPWSDGTIYWDAGNVDDAADSYDRISKGASADIFKGSWKHAIFTKNIDTGKMQIYIDGQLWHEGTGKTMPITGIASFKIGSGDSTTYKGYMDDFRIYNYAFDGFDAARLYTAVSGTTICVEDVEFDLNDDCKIDLADMAILASQWFKCNMVPDCR